MNKGNSIRFSIFVALWFPYALMSPAFAQQPAKPVAATSDTDGSERLRVTQTFLRTGKRTLEGQRIVGGKIAADGTHPWQVALISSEGKNVLDAFFCGGSLYKQNWVITAAHCVTNGTRPGQVDVVVGTQDLRSGGQRLKVAAIIVHADYNKGIKYNNDIALLRLAAPATITGVATITPVSVVEESALASPKATVTTSGWGAIYQGASPVPRLREVSVPIVPMNGVCDDRVSYGKDVNDNMICAGEQGGGKDSCQGDSGGPLTAGSGSARRLVGVVSWGHGCANPDKYGVYTRVANYAKWISENAK